VPSAGRKNASWWQLKPKPVHQTDSKPAGALRDEAGRFFDPRSVGAFRIAFGLVLLANLYLRTAHGRLQAFYTEEGVLPLALLIRGTRWSFLDAFTTVESARWAVLGIALVYLAYTAGLFTRVTKWLVVVCLVSLYHRNPLVDDGSDWVMRLMAMWTALLPLGERFSIDALLRRGRGLSGEPTSRLTAALLCANLSLSYLLNAVQKDGVAWTSGDAVRLVLWDPWVAAPLGVLLREHGSPLLFTLLSKGTICLELALAIFVGCAFLRPWISRVAALLIVALHGGFGLFMFLGTFVPVYLSVALLFIPGRDWARLGINALRGDQAEPPGALGLVLRRLPAVGMAIWCALQMIRNNPVFPPEVKQLVQQATPAAVERFSAFMVITQEWFMFRAPAIIIGVAVVRARQSDGTEIDPIRETPFDPIEPTHRSRHMGKYWVSYLFRLTMAPGYDRYRAAFARYLFSRGMTDFSLLRTEIFIPAIGEEPKHAVQEVFGQSIPREIEADLTVARIRGAGMSLGQQDMTLFGNTWTRGNQLYAIFTQPDSALEIVLPWALNCTPTLSLTVTEAPDYGTFKISLNDRHLADLNLRNRLGVVRATYTLGEVSLRSGENRLMVEPDRSRPLGQVGFGLDTLRLECR